MAAMARFAPTRRQLLSLPLAAASRARAQEEEGHEPVRLPRHISMPDPQLPYVQRLVSLALAHAGSARPLQLVDLEMAQGRSLVELSQGRSAFDLLWTVTDREREESALIPIRIPIDRGLMGWRLLLIRRNDLSRWRPPPTREILQSRLAGQSHDWPDTSILRANGFAVATAGGYDALFRMLAAGRFEYFPRSILEIDAELASGRHPELTIAPAQMLHYPAAAYLFVSPTRPALAAELQQGLEAAVADGSFQRLHHEFFGALIRQHAAARSHVVRMTNPLLPDSVPLKRRELWLQPDAL